MKKPFLILMGLSALTFVGCAKEEAVVPPPYAASAQTWVFGDQTWSDAIHDPECDKSSFDDSYDKADGRSYIYEGNTYYYYNWPYVDENAERLCPSPWRVPTKDDFDLMDDHTNASSLIAAWGYGGYAQGTSMDNVSERAYYWSSTQYGSDRAYFLYYDSGGLSVGYYHKYYGFQVRCVK